MCKSLRNHKKSTHFWSGGWRVMKSGIIKVVSRQKRCSSQDWRPGPEGFIACFGGISQRIYNMSCSPTAKLLTWTTAISNCIIWSKKSPTQKRPTLVKRSGIRTTSDHTSTEIQQKHRELSWEVHMRPSYGPDLSLRDYYLCQLVKIGCPMRAV